MNQMSTYTHKPELVAQIFESSHKQTIAVYEGRFDEEPCFCIVHRPTEAVAILDYDPVVINQVISKIETDGLVCMRKRKRWVFRFRNNAISLDQFVYLLYAQQSDKTADMRIRLLDGSLLQCGIVDLRSDNLCDAFGERINSSALSIEVLGGNHSETEHIYVQLNDGLCEEYYDYSPELYEILTHGCYTSFYPHEGERIYVRAGYKSCKRSIALSRLVGLYHTFFGKYGGDVEAFCKAIPALTTDYELEYDHVNACANIGCRENLIAVQSGLNRVKGELPKYFQLVGTSIFPLSDGDGHILVEYPSLTGKALYRRCESPEAFLDWLQFSMGRSVLTQNLEAVVGQYGDRASVKGFFTKPKGVVLEEVSFENWYHRKEAIVALYASEPDCFVPYRIGDYSDINKLVDELRRLTGQNVSVAVSRIG